jgi:hypothetical protein
MSRAVLYLGSRLLHEGITYRATVVNTVTGNRSAEVYIYEIVIMNRPKEFYFSVQFKTAPGGELMLWMFSDDEKMPFAL